MSDEKRSGDRSSSVMGEREGDQVHEHHHPLKCAVVQVMHLKKRKKIMTMNEKAVMIVSFSQRLYIGTVDTIHIE